MKPRVCILKTDGTNCDKETAHAFECAGADVQTVLLNRLFTHKEMLHDFHILVIPGGFSYGDDIASGKIFAQELEIFLHQQLHTFVSDKKLILGICNGFQVLVRAKLLPAFEHHRQHITLTTNDSGRFECRWVSLQVEKSNCVFTHGLEERSIMLPIAHAEGKVYAHAADLERLEQEQVIPVRYAAQTYPTNPNGSLHAIAGICDPTGHVFGLMPHPERFIYAYQHPHHTRDQVKPMGRIMFENAVAYAAQL